MRIYLREDNEDTNVPLHISFGTILDHCTDSNIEQIAIPDNVKTIETYAFYNCKKLRRIQLPPYLETILSDAFSNCESLEEITIPPRVQGISSYDFHNCKSLKKVNILPDNLYVGNDMFKGCPEDIDIQYKGMHLSVDDFDNAFYNEYGNEEEEMDRWLEIEYVVAEYNKRKAMQKQDEDDIAAGRKTDAMLFDETDFGF